MLELYYTPHVMHVKAQDSSWGTSFCWEMMKDFTEEELQIWIPLDVYIY